MQYSKQQLKERKEWLLRRIEISRKILKNYEKRYIELLKEDKL